MTEIFIVGYYGHRNAGDEVILSAILSGLRKALSGACFTVISHDPEETAAKHGVRAIPWFEPQAIAEATERAQLVVVGGGGLFHDTLGFVPNLLLTKQSWGLALYAGAALYGSLAQKRVMLWGVGVGPLGSDLAREYTKAACLAADVVTVRDELSKDLLVAAGVPASSIIVTADCAFASKPCGKSAPALVDSVPEQASPGPRVAVVVREWSVGVCSRDWERQLAEALNKFARREGGRLVFVPFQTLETEKENDLAVARRIASQLRPRTDVTILQERLAPQEVKALIAECDLVVGMRLHSIVFAAQAGVPVVALSYDPKVSALMTRLALRRFDCPLRDIQSGTLRDLMTQALEQRSKISASLRAASEELASEAGRNAALACQLMQRPVERKSLPPELVPIVARAIKGQIAAAKQMDERMKSRQAQVEELSARVARQHADNEELIEQVRQRREKVEELSAFVSKQHADKEELIEQARRQREKVGELSALVSKQHADKEELIGQVRQRREKVEELSACVSKQHADNEQLSGQLEQRREQIEALSAGARKQQADNEQLISSVAEKEGEVVKLQEQLQGRDRFVLQLEQQHAVEKRELEKRLQELTRDHAQALELSADLRQELATARESLQQLALVINRRLSVRLRRSLHKLLDISQARTPEPLRRALRGLYLPVYRLLFPGGKGEFETLDSLESSNMSLREHKGPPA